MQEMGVPIEIIDQAIELDKPTDLYVDQLELDAITLFARVQTQWNRNDMTGQKTGLDYSGVRNVAEILDLKLDANLLSCLQVMEVEVISESAKRREE